MRSYLAGVFVALALVLGACSSSNAPQPVAVQAPSTCPADHPDANDVALGVDAQFGIETAARANAVEAKQLTDYINAKEPVTNYRPAMVMVYTVAKGQGMAVVLVDAAGCTQTAALLKKATYEAVGRP